MWYLFYPDREEYLAAIEKTQITTVPDKQQAKSFDSEDFAEGYALAVEDCTGVFLEAKDGSEED